MVLPMQTICLISDDGLMNTECHDSVSTVTSPVTSSSAQHISQPPW